MSVILRVIESAKIKLKDLDSATTEELGLAGKLEPKMYANDYELLIRQGREFDYYLLRLAEIYVRPTRQEKPWYSYVLEPENRSGGEESKHLILFCPPGKIRNSIGGNSKLVKTESDLFEVLDKNRANQRN